MVSVFDLFKIGIGPSSSHTVGPMKAAYQFLQFLEKTNQLGQTTRLQCELYGSLAHTGIGHNTHVAILLGLAGHLPETIDPAHIPESIQTIRKAKTLQLFGQHAIAFVEKRDLIFHRDQSLPFHSNGMRFSAFNGENKTICQKIYYSVGGGFVLDEVEIQNQTTSENRLVPFPFKNAKSLIQICEKEALTIAEVMFLNEKTQRSEAEIQQGLLQLWETMQACVKRGLQNEGVLPGGLNLKRRAPALHRELTQHAEANMPSLTELMDWVNLFALAVNEENAAGGQVVTAPTNGAAGVIPAIMHYYDGFVKTLDSNSLQTFLLTAAAIGILYKEGASISAAEVGCQGEIGVACSMAAAALTAVRGGTTTQITNAAEIGMEHNLGLTCDPVGGLVQIPCIERNTMGSIQAINASNLALRGNGEHHISLDKVIATMHKTGEDMLSHYKETSLGGLAVNSVEC